MLTKLITDIPLIQRRCEENEDKDYNFRAFLKGGLGMRDAELDAIVRETTDEVWSHIDCLKCANCCRALTVSVDDDDIQRLATRLDMAFEEFSEQYVEIDEYQDKQIGGLPCPFLGQDNRCIVYEDRPKNCREFPYLHKNGFRQRSLGVISNAAVCPIVFNVWKELKAKLWRRK